MRSCLFYWSPFIPTQSPEAVKQNNTKSDQSQIEQTKEEIRRLLSSAGNLANLIADNPEDFLKNLIGGLKLGFNNFASNIRKHLQNALISWLTGTLGSIQMPPPNTPTVKGFFSIALQVLNITWESIRAKAVDVYGEAMVQRMVKGVAIFRQVQGRPMELWNHVHKLIQGQQNGIIEEIKTAVVTTVIVELVKKFISFLSPAAGIQALITIYNILQFFIEQCYQVMELVKAVIDAVHAIAAGKMDGIASSVEKALSRSLPVLIGTLAAALGIGSVATRIRSIINRMQQSIDRTIIYFLRKVRGLVPAVSQGNANRGQTSSRGQRSQPPSRNSGNSGRSQPPRQTSGTAGRSQQQTPTNRTGTARNSAPQRRFNIEVRFRDAAGENHRMWIQIIRSRYRLMVASGNPDPVEDSVKQGGKFADIDGKQEQEVISNARQAEQLANQNSQNNNPSVANQIRSNMNEIKPILETSNGELPRTHVTYGANGKKAGWVLAEPLTRLPSNTRGSRATFNIPGWDYVQKMPDQEKKYWDKVHLLSAEFHGPGDFWNLVPARKIDNAWMREHPEQTVKNYFMTERNAILYYYVSVAYHEGTQDESNFPCKITVTFGYLKRKANGGYERNGQNTLSRDLIKPPSIETAHVFDINVIGERTFGSLGIPARAARNIIRERNTNGRFTSDSNFLTRMNLFYNKISNFNPASVKNFEAEYWPIIKALIDSNRLRF